MATSKKKRSSWRAAAAVIASVALVLTGAVAPATAAEGDPEYLTVDKSVSPGVVSPGQPFTYTIAVNCSEASCLEATLDDALPAELAGYTVQSVTTQPSAASVPRDVTWTVDGAVSGATPGVITADTSLHVDFTGATTAPAGTGLQNGQTFTVTITLQVPDDLPPGTQVITNTAETAATNSSPDSSDATIEVVTPETIDVAATKSWSPSPQSYRPGASSTIDIAVVNASNGPVEKLVIQEPQNAVDGATALDASNPFTITDFTGFGDATLPAGADQVQVDLYLQQADGTWAWVPGSPSSSVELSEGVDPADVGGIRLTYTGTAIEQGATGVTAIEVAQRSTQRDTDADLSTEAHAVDNVVEASAEVTDRDPATATAGAHYEVIPVNVAASTTKNITPGRIAAGDSADGRITGTNTSDAGVDVLTVSDRDFFTEDIAFDGFSAAPVWPATATAATATFYPLDGSDPIAVPFTNGETPVVPGGVAISGFELSFTAEDGGIDSGASTVIDFVIQTGEDALSEDEDQLTVTNSATTEVIAPNGNSAEATDDADLTLLTPEIDITLDKTIRPSSSVEPGEPVVSELKANLTTTSDYVTATQIVVEDAYAGDGTFWDAFDLTSIASTQVPSNTSLTIEVQNSSGTWQTLEVFPAESTARLISMSEAEVATALTALGLTSEDVQGIRFTFQNDAGFASDTTVTPYFTSTARETLRSDDSKTVPGDAQPVSYENTATATGSGQTESGTTLTDTDEDTGEATIETYANEGVVGIHKRWNDATVSAQSQQVRSTTLSWRTSADFDQVIISDPSTSAPAFDDASAPGDPVGTVFDAFDLVNIRPIPADDEPFSNGWFIQYDTIDAVELYYEEAWHTVAEPAGGWIQNGGFVGYALTAQEQAATTGFRIALSPNTAARDASDDPFVDAIGDGVGASSSLRTFDLTWQIRDKKRSDDSWVTESETYNHDDAGVVDNTTRIDGITDGDVHSDTDSDTIIITDPDPGVTVTKSVSPSSPLYVPAEGADPSSYPSATFRIEARNDSVAKSSYIRVTDPPVCTDSDEMSVCQSEGTAAGALADPFTADIDWLTVEGQGNPFDRFDLTGVTISAAIADQVDLDESIVWLLRYDAGAYTTQQTTAAAVNAMSAAELADVVGISVTFQGTDPATTGGTITPANVLSIEYDVQVRPTLRSTDDPQVLTANEKIQVPNRVFAQSYDPILSDGTQTGARDAAAPTLTGGDLNVGPVKTVSPDALTEPVRDSPVTVTLGANQGTDPVSTLSPAEVRLTDDVTSSPDFWDAFDFIGLGDIVAPAGADQVVVSVYGPFGEDGELIWVASDATAVNAPVVPLDAAQYGDIQGVSFAFSRADGAYLSPAVPAPSWSTTAAFTVQLRDEYRASGDAIPMEGTIENTMTAVGDRLDGDSAEAETSADIDLSAGTQQLAVNKTVNEGATHFASAGDLLPWDLTFTNDGTGYLTITQLTDLLPAELAYLGDAPVYTPDPDGLLPEPEGFAQDGDTLVFTWADGSRMAPGESFSVRIMLELQPGLGVGEQAVNEMAVQTVETLDSCTNAVDGGSVTDAWEQDATTCGTTDYVTPAQGTSLFTVKGVRGEREGAINPNNPAAECLQNFEATGGSYFRSPCAANSEIGGTDDWVLRTQNGGTTPIRDMVIFDQFPVAGDQSLISGSSRGSVYRPQLLDAIELAAPEGTTTAVEVTFSSGVCAGTWSGLTTQEPCAQNGEEWVVADDSTDWSTVSGLRVTLDFTSTASGALQPGEFVDITYSAANVVASEENPSGAPSAVPASDSFAWNQFGVKYRDVNSNAYGRIAPSAVGVHLVFGALRIDKEITGPAAASAPAEFLADVVCTIDGVELDMGEYATVALNADNEYEQRIDGIPFGASCTITEQGETGSFGEASRSGSPTTVDIDEATGLEDEIPASNVVSLVNNYEFSGLSLTKIVDTDAAAGHFGPFDFTLVCMTAAGGAVLFDGEAELAFSLEDGETFTAPAGTIPARSTCTVTEVGSAAADDIVVTGTGVTDLGDGSAEVAVGTDDAEVAFTNSYDTAVLTIVKDVDGEGADLYGNGPFTFSVVCTYQGQTLVDGEFEIEANSTRTFGPYPTTTNCIVEEVGAGGATSTVLDPEDGTVELTQDAEAAVIAVNTFDLTSVAVTKVREGDLDADGADGPFTVELVCALPVDGEDREIAIPGGAERTLSAENDYTVAYASLPVNALCAITETDTGDAVSTEIMVTGADGLPVAASGTTADVDLADAAEPVQVEITNTFVKDLPQTGPAGLVGLALAVVLLLGGGGALVLIARRRRAEAG